MAFDWQRFFEAHRIPYVTRGPNINRNQIGIKCPLCGHADPSEHMVLPLGGVWWSCRRNKHHGSDKPNRLVQLLLGCTQEAAAGIVGDQTPIRSRDSDFASQVRQLAAGRRQATTEALQLQPKPLAIPPEFKVLRPEGLGRMAWNYMLSRHYTDDQLRRLVQTYDLRYATTGRYANRVIIPVYTPEGLFSWTGRAISVRSELRYMSHSAMDYYPNNPPPIYNIHDLLLNEHDLNTGGETLVLVEGPFDALRLDFFGYPQLRATCMFSKSLTSLQVTKLVNFSRRYNKRYVLLDKDASLDVLPMQSSLVAGRFQARMMNGGKDAAALTEPEIKHLIANFLK